MLSKVALLSAVLLSCPALIAGQDADADDKIGFSGELSSLDAGLGGTVNVVDANTLEIPDFVIEDASAPALYWWGAVDENLEDGFRISEQEVTEESDGELLEIPLDSGFTTADFWKPQTEAVRPLAPQPTTTTTPALAVAPRPVPAARALLPVDLKKTVRTSLSQ